MIVLLRLGAALFRCIDALLGNICTPLARDGGCAILPMIHTSTCRLPHYKSQQKKIDHITRDPFIVVAPAVGWVHCVTRISLCIMFRGSP